jgi:hypothetical protein
LISNHQMPPRKRTRRPESSALPRKPRLTQQQREASKLLEGGGLEEYGDDEAAEGHAEHYDDDDEPLEGLAEYYDDGDYDDILSSTEGIAGAFGAGQDDEGRNGMSLFQLEKS